MIKLLKPKTAFARNVLTIMTGTTIAQAIPIVISPILTRIYTPEYLGIFALYMSITSIMSVMATGRYELSIMLPKKDEEAINILVLSIVISFFVCFMSYILVFIFNQKVSALLGNHDISSWLYFIPSTVLLTGIYQSFNYWTNRKEKYKTLAICKVVQSGTISTSGVGLGLSGFESSGLIFGQILGQCSTVIILGVNFWKNYRNLIKKINKLKVIALFKKYSKFPMFDLPSSIMYAFYTNMSIIFFTNFFESSIAGMYFFANRLIKIPFSFFLISFSEVFYQKLSKSKNKKEITKEINYFSIKILKFTFIPFVIVIYSSPLYVEFVFGDEWRELYIYIIIFSMPVYMSLLLAPYGHVLKIVNRQEISMTLHSFKALILICFFISYYYINYGLLWFLFVYSIFDAVTQVFLAYTVDRIISNNFKKTVNQYRMVVFCLLTAVNYEIIMQSDI